MCTRALLCSARSRRPACEGRQSRRRPSSPSEAHSSKKDRGHPTGGSPTVRALGTLPDLLRPSDAGTELPPRSRCSLRSPGGPHLATTARGSSSPRCSPRAWWRTGHDVTLFATADSVTAATLHATSPTRVVGGRARSTRRSPNAFTSPRCSNEPTSSTSSTTASTSSRSPTRRWSTRRS